MSRTADESPAPPAGESADAGAEPPALPPREELERHPHHVLKDEGPGAPRVVRYDLPGGPVVLKEWLPSGSRLVDFWGHMILRREIRNYRVLDGTPGIPRFVGAYSDRCFVMAWVDAHPLKRKLPQDLKDRALVDLETKLEGLHARRFVHLDLHQKLNALVTPEGKVWFVDLGQGFDCSRNLFLKLLFPLMVRVDRRAIVKFRARYAPHMLPEADRDRLVERHKESRGKAWKHLHRRIRKRLTRP